MTAPNVGDGQGVLLYLSARIVRHACCALNIIVIILLLILIIIICTLNKNNINDKTNADSADLLLALRGGGHEVEVPHRLIFTIANTKQIKQHKSK
jgi:hypothetical protein